MGFIVHRSSGVMHTVLGGVGPVGDVDPIEFEVMEGVKDAIASCRLTSWRLKSADRASSTAVRAGWLYSDNEIPFSVYWHGARQAILDTFVEHESKSLQYTLHSMAEAVLERY